MCDHGSFAICVVRISHIYVIIFGYKRERALQTFCLFVTKSYLCCTITFCYCMYIYNISITNYLKCQIFPMWSFLL